MAGEVLSTVEFGNPDDCPIVAIHGGWSTGESWRRAATEGFPGRWWLCPDLPGFGKSARGRPPWTFGTVARDVIATLKLHEVERADLIGGSLGARVVTEMCKEAPELVRNAVLLDPPLMSNDEWKNWVYSNREALARREFESVDELISFHPQDLSPSVREYARREKMAALEPMADGRFRLRVDKDVFEALMETMCETPVSFGAYSGDVLVVVARRFDAVTGKGIEYLSNQLDDRLTSVTIDSGHQLWWGAFEQTVNAIENFLPGSERV